MTVQYLSDRDYQDYGGDLVSFSKKAALEAVVPHLENLERQNDVLQRRLAIEARHRLDAAVEQAVPNFREIDSDPRWHSWLLGTDVLSGRQRQSLLNESIASGSASRTVSFFRQFLREADYSRSGAPSASYGRARTSANGPVYSRAQIAKLFDQHRRGAYNGREAEWQRQEADIIRASAEGRITGGVDVAGK